MPNAVATTRIAMIHLIADKPSWSAARRILPVQLLVVLACFATSAESIASPLFQDRPVTGEVMIDEGYEVREGELLKVDVPDADVVVKRSADSDARVLVTLNGTNMDKARRYFKKQAISVSHVDGVVAVISERVRRNVSISWNINSGNPQITITVEIPETFDVDLSTSDGDVAVGTIRGTVSIRSSDGDLSADLLVGPSVQLKSSDGDIDAGTISSAKTSLRTSDGDINVDAISGDELDVVSSDGTISIGALEGSGSVRTSDGDIDIDSGAGRSIEVRTADGEIVIGQLASANATVKTSDGSIRIEEFEGDLKATSSDGSLFVRLDQRSSANMRTGDGDITIIAPAAFAASIQLSGNNVRVASGFSFRGTVQKRKADGELNGGGPLVSARASGGNVYLRTRE